MRRLTVVALLGDGGGGVVGRLTGRPALKAGVRQLLLGALAVSVTYAVGRLINTSVS